MVAVIIQEETACVMPERGYYRMIETEREQFRRLEVNNA